MFLHNGSDLAEKLHGESNGVGWICKSKEMIVEIVCLVEVLKLNRSDCLTNSIRWVHTKLSKYTSSIYLRRTSDVNGSILISALYGRLLCSRGNACSSKPPKYTFKSSSTRLTCLRRLYLWALSNQDEEVETSIKL